jgi:hypothetical protein
MIRNHQDSAKANNRLANSQLCEGQMAEGCCFPLGKGAANARKHLTGETGRLFDCEISNDTRLHSLRVQVSLVNMHD